MTPKTKATSARTTDEIDGSKRSDQGGVQTTTSHYERIEEIGSGGIGTVYRAIQTELGREVAVKEISDVFNVFADLQRDDIIEQFKTVVQEQSKLNHPNIVDIYGIETQVEYPFVVTEHAPYGNLRSFIETDERPPLDIALKYFVQILSALRAAHHEDLVHGNLKPENVLLDESGNAKLSDFGLSRLVQHENIDHNQVYVGVGTVAYMSPEQFRAPNSASVKSDIYSLGIMFYEMLTGKVPGRRSPMPSSFFPNIPHALDDIFDAMSMDAKEDRYDSVDQILTELYSSEEVIELLDPRTGFVFLQNPLEEGGYAADMGQHNTSVPSSPTNFKQLSPSDESEPAPEPTDRDEPDIESNSEEQSDGDSSSQSSDDSGDVEPDDVEQKLGDYEELFED